MRITTPMGFEHTKAAHVAAFLLLRAGVPVTKLKLIKLVYIAEREFLRQYGRSMTLDTFCSLPHGPVASAVLDGLNGRLETTVIMRATEQSLNTRLDAALGDIRRLIEAPKVVPFAKKVTYEIGCSVQHDGGVWQVVSRAGSQGEWPSPTSHAWALIGDGVKSCNPASTRRATTRSRSRWPRARRSYIRFSAARSAIARTGTPARTIGSMTWLRETTARLSASGGTLGSTLATTTTAPGHWPLRDPRDRRRATRR